MAKTRGRGRGVRKRKTGSATGEKGKIVGRKNHVGNEGGEKSTEQEGSRLKKEAGTVGKAYHRDLQGWYDQKDLRPLGERSLTSGRRREAGGKYRKKRNRISGEKKEKKGEGSTGIGMGGNRGYQKGTEKKRGARGNWFSGM